MRNAIALALVLCSPGLARAQHDDHPLVSRYAGSVVLDKKFEAFGSYKLVTKLDDRSQPDGIPLEGKVTRFVYQNPQGRSTLEIFRNYSTALVAAGLEVMFTCANDECGLAFARSAWARFNGLFVTADGDPRYLAGSLRTADGTAYVALMVGRIRTQLDIVEIVAMEGGLVVVDADALARGLDRDGRVSVPGIYFDTDKSDVKPESKPALDEVTALLRARPELRVFVVGHTDMTGDLAHNRQLSEARARAVATVLVSQYGIAAARLEGYGVGPLSPAATNTTDAGKTLNRRVELVAR